MSFWFWRFLVTCGLLFSCASCVVVAPDGSDSPSFTSTPIVPRRLCELLDACGGDVVGEWTTEDVCVSYMTAGKPPVANCEGSTVEAIIDDVQGSYSFHEDGTYRANMKYVGEVIVSSPMRCLRPGFSCEDLIPDDDGTRCIARGDRCECAQDWELDSGGDIHGTYETIGSTIEFSNDGPVEFCAKADRLTMRTIAEIPRFGADLTAELQFELRRK